MKKRALGLSLVVSSGLLLSGCIGFVAKTSTDDVSAVPASSGSNPHWSQRTPNNHWSQRMQSQQDALTQAAQGTGVIVTRTAANEIKVLIPSDISFDTNRAVIKPAFAPLLSKFAEGLKNYPNTQVCIVGHTDSTGSDAINDPLSVNRAVSTQAYLVSHGVGANTLQTLGRGSHEPIATNNTVSGRTQNRRVEIFVREIPRG